MLSNKRNIISAVFIAVVAVLALDACTRDEEIRQPATGESWQLILRWNPAYPDDTREQAELGLQWCLSYLGALLPVGGYDEGLQWTTPDRIRMDVSKLGFDETALRAFSALLPRLRASDEYIKTGAIDLGRFVMLTLNSSNHYYRITGAKRTFPAFRSQFRYDPKRVAIIESSVSKGERLLQLATGTDIRQWGFIAAEGTGSLKNGTFLESAHEVFDIMPNGQLRFAIYDDRDQLAISANAMHTNAGKPAKCLWCHEVVIQPSFEAVTSVPGYYRIDSFAAVVSRQMDLLTGYRSGLSSRLDFSGRQDHTKMELLYISFMEPSAQRLAREWGVSQKEVTTRLAALSTHRHDEFPFLGNLYHREQVEPYSPFAGIRVPGNAREASDYEPDLIP